MWPTWGHVTKGWRLFVSLLQMDKFGDHRHCDMGDLIVLIDHVTSRVHVFKGLGNFVSGSLFVINDSQK